MRFVETKIPGCFIIEPTIFNDKRGTFVKTFHQEEFKEYNLECNFKENYYTVSKKGVIRGMHFQRPPHDHAKVVSTMRGAMIDIVLDLRKASPMFKHHIQVEVTYENHRQIYIPRGCAHGFITLVDDTCVSYLQTTNHVPECDTGVLFSSLGIDCKTDSPILSDRDRTFPSINEFDSPF